MRERTFLQRKHQENAVLAGNEIPALQGLFVVEFTGRKWRSKLEFRPHASINNIQFPWTRRSLGALSCGMKFSPLFWHLLLPVAVTRHVALEGSCLDNIRHCHSQNIRSNQELQCFILKWRNAWRRMMKMYWSKDTSPFSPSHVHSGTPRKCG